MDHLIARLDQQDAWFAAGAAPECDTTLTVSGPARPGALRSSMRPTRPRGVKAWPAHCGLAAGSDLVLTYTVPATAG